MKLLTAALVIILLTTTSAKPIRWRWHHDADIADSNMKQGWDGNNMWWRFTESSNYKDSSSESQESSQSSESSQSQSSEESSEEVLVTDQPMPPMTTTTKTITGVTNIPIEEGSTPTPETGTINTDEPIVTDITPIATSSDNVTRCITVEIPTVVPITNNRGDN